MPPMKLDSIPHAMRFDIYELLVSARKTQSFILDPNRKLPAYRATACLSN